MENKRTYDYGLAILRMIMCFMVVLCHFWDATNVVGFMKVFSVLRGYAVPVFMIMSFIFAQSFLIKHDKDKVKSRFERLLIPQVGWAIIYWLVYYIISRFITTGLDLKISDMFWQMFTGHSPKLNATMWYQVNLIYLTALFLIVIILFKDKHKYILCGLLVLAYVLQYTGLNSIFSSLRYELCYPLGRFAEMIPLAVIGYLFSSEKVIDKVKEHRIISISISLIVIVIALVLSKIYSPQGFGYQGIHEALMGASLVIIFSAIPFEKLNDKFLAILKFITQYTMGIYCIHRLIGTLINGLLTHFNLTFLTPNSFIECILIYFIGFVASMIGFKIFKNTKLKSLFN